MRPLDLILHLVIGSTFAGVLVTVALVAGATSSLVLLVAVLGGMVLATAPTIAIRRALVAPPASTNADNDIANR